MSQKKPNKDIFERLKYIGYCWSNLPPENVETDLEDFIRYCKFQLCKASNRLMKDPIWEEYCEEEIIAEYYAHLYATSKDAREKFEHALQGMDEDIYDWLDKMIAENQKELENKSDELEEGFDFAPDSLGE